MDYNKVIQQNDTYWPDKLTNSVAKLPPASYSLQITPQGQMYFKKQAITSDKIINLPSGEYDKVVQEMSVFLRPEKRAIFEGLGFLYKRSFLLHGLPGTGKTVIVNRVVQDVIANNGVVLFNPDPRLLPEAFKVLDDLQPEALTMVILEEFDGLVKRFGEDHYLSILDGEVQKNNVIFFATTNFIDRIPPRLYRPGRISSKIEVGFPSAEARKHYLSIKMNGSDESEINTWVEQTKGFSIDELKEVVLAVKCLGKPLSEVLHKIRALKKDISSLTQEHEIKTRVKERISAGWHTPTISSTLFETEEDG